MPESVSERLAAALASLPLVAILRGLTPPDAEATGAALFAEGFRLIEVPLNSPAPFESIRRLRESLPSEVIVGAGTVLSVEAVTQLSGVGGDLVVMPHTDTQVIRAAKAMGLACIPGIATPTEAFTALDAGADALKLFPAEMVGAPALKAMRSVLPKGARLFPVGGITPQTMADFVAAGAAGFGLGSALYLAGASPDDTARRAGAFAGRWRQLAGPESRTD